MCGARTAVHSPNRAAATDTSVLQPRAMTGNGSWIYNSWVIYFSFPIMMISV
jgi:hypothetical protein